MHDIDASRARSTCPAGQGFRLRERIGLLAAGPVVLAAWLVLAAAPVLADGGPHVVSTNSGSLGLTADGCAGCHRAHTSSGPFLINAVDETALCLTCHGAAVGGATTDVMTGIQYRLGDPLPRGDVALGALRAGGFDQARLDTANATRRSYTVGSSVKFLAKVPVGAPLDATSAHLDLDGGNGVVASGIAWGNGANGSGAGPTVEMSCTTCHNPHGNGQYRILRPIPNPVATNGVFTAVAAPGAPVTDTPVVNPATGLEDTKNYTVLQVRGTEGVDVSYLLYARQVVAASAAGTFRIVAGIASSDAATDRFTTTSPHGFAAGNSVTIAGHDAVSTPPINGTFTVASVPTTTTFTLTGVDITTGGTGVGTVTKNTGAIAGEYGPAGGDYFHRYVPWNQSSPVNRNYDAPNGRPTTFNTQMTAWCTACHTRYNSNDPYLARPGDSTFMYQHQTVADGSVCTTCHLSHGSNAGMPGTFSATMPYPDGSVKVVPDTTTIVAASRLLKFDNRGTCQACHDPTGTVGGGTYTGPVPSPGVP